MTTIKKTYLAITSDKLVFFSPIIDGTIDLDLTPKGAIGVGSFPSEEDAVNYFSRKGWDKEDFFRKVLHEDGYFNLESAFNSVGDASTTPKRKNKVNDSDYGQSSAGLWL